MDLIGDYVIPLAGGRGRGRQAARLPAVDPRDSRHQLLNRIFEQHCLLSLRFAHERDAFQSAIVELVPDAGYLVLDALVPDTGNALATVKQVIHLQTRLGGIDVRFSSRITARGSQGGLPYYQAAYPLDIEHQQRRREFRVSVPFDRGMEVRYFPPAGGCIRGEVRDLSPSGFCARLLSGDVAALTPKDSRHGRCEIDLAAGLTLHTEAAICHVMPGRARSAPRIGACFTHLDARSERLLEQCCATLERERLRPL